MLRTLTYWSACPRGDRIPAFRRAALSNGPARNIKVRFSDEAANLLDTNSFQIHQPRDPSLVPRKYIVALQNSGLLELTGHIRWMMQKDALGQDIFLIGAPGPLRRRLALSFCELAGREAELLTLSQDTTEADLKQRREIVDSTALYVDQAPLRAALEGRVLILDGMEKAERNVLPTLNNLLENREMALSDGRFLISANRYDSLLSDGETADDLRAAGLLRVSEHFRVIALGLSVPEFPGYPLDPPLRSRFQGRYISALSNHKQLLHYLHGMSTGSDHTNTSKRNAPSEQLSQIASLFHAVSHIKAKHIGGETGGADVLTTPKLLPVPETALADSSAVVSAFPLISVRDVIQSVYPYQLFGLDNVQRAALSSLISEICKPDASSRDELQQSLIKNGPHPRAIGTQQETLDSLLRTHEIGEDICLIGDKGEGMAVIIDCVSLWMTNSYVKGNHT